MLGMMFVGAIMPTPLYPLFRAAFGFSGVTLTLIYAVYVLGNLAALLLFGRLADQIGRRAVSAPAIGVGIASALAFAFAASTPWLFAGRALSGFSTGLASGTATAWIAELYPDRGEGAASRIAAAALFGPRRGPAHGRRAGTIRAGAAAAAVPRLSGSALRYRGRDFSRARDGGGAKTLGRGVAQATARRAAKHPPAIHRTRGRSFRRLRADRLLRGLGAAPARQACICPRR